MPLRLLKHPAFLTSLVVHAGLVGGGLLIRRASTPIDRPALLLGVEASEVTGSVDADVPPPDVPESALVVDPIPDVVPDAPTPEEAEVLPPDDRPVADSTPDFTDRAPVGVRIRVGRPSAATPTDAGLPSASGAPVRPVVTLAPSRRGARAESRSAERIGNAAPPYPAEALRRHWEGTAILDVRVTPEGTVSEATIYESSGSRVLDDASIAAALTYRYTPRLVDGTPAPDWLRVPFVWRLSGS